MMKVILLLCFIFVAFGKVRLVTGRGRTNIIHEPVALELEFAGSCAQFQTNWNSIQVSLYQSPSCLPIDLNSPLLDDNNDVNADVHCVNINHGQRSLVRFVEVYTGTDDTQTLAPGSYIISLVSNIPFRAKGIDITYITRPTCTIAADFCQPHPLIIDTCTNNVVVLDNGFVNIPERVYFFPSTQIVRGCFDSTSACCPYISKTAPTICTRVV
eukprot:TRINITY_DN15388_c0_g1_i1.p1 TRINITY_DN15388_c0_g1~~TRINITY_DN15388_c0_g1_i1.p1  ORF type:complete len:213 (+),score=33.35 TRINITY_DN15388_c0_g1_i1:80-718(+)